MKNKSGSLLMEKVKGAALAMSGAALIVFVYNFDSLVGKPRELGFLSIFVIAIGIIMIINGFRIYRRK